MAAYTTINKPSLHFNTKLFTGNGSNDHAITGVGFQPDWVWIKSRANTYDHMIHDVVRGQYKNIRSNLTNAEGTDTSGVKSFDTDGFTTNNGGYTNGNGVNFASWNWKAGNSQGSSNTDGSINTTYTSANTTAGFSISKYTGTGSNATVGHGLGVRPDLVFTKRLDTTANWVVMSVGSSNSAPYQTIGSNDSNLGLNLTRQVSGSEAVGDNRLSTNSSNTIYNIGNDASINASGGTYIAYYFAGKRGYSKFGNYTGNGNADGTFIYTGFKPAWIMAKKSNSTGNWVIVDTKRDGYNGANDTLQANVTDAEGGGNRFDIVSNGFKARSTSAYSNSSGDTFIYMAFAEAPLVDSTGKIPATAR